MGVSFGSWPGFDLTPGPEFWALLPAFVAVTLVGTIETIGDGVAIQRVSRRKRSATDFRVVQGALNADGMGNLLSGILGALPNTTYSTSVALPDVTGIAARRVGVIIGVIFLALAFLPKFAAVLIAIPAPVAAAYIMILLGLLFVQGMKIVIQDGVDHRKAAVAGLAFWIGVGFQNQWIFAEQLGGRVPGRAARQWHDFGGHRRDHHDGVPGADGTPAQASRHPLDADALPKLVEFLREFASKAGWNAASTERVVLVGEETLAILSSEEDENLERTRARRLIATVRADGRGAELEFVSGYDGENLEDRLAYLGETPDIADGREISFRLLRHYASSVRHQKYHGEDVVTVRVENPR